MRDLFGFHPLFYRMSILNDNNQFARGCLSFSLWGPRDSPYHRGVEQNLLRARSIYPNWAILLYVSRRAISDADLTTWTKLGCKVVLMDITEGWSGMFWRMLPILSNSYDYVCVRDLDSIITTRESAAVDDWISDGSCLHIMRDHPAHTASIMGGMFGVKTSCAEVRNAFSGIKQLILESCYTNKNNFWQSDQIYLANHVYPLLRNSAKVHDPYYERLAFPTDREAPHMYIGRPTMKLGYQLTSDDESILNVDQYITNYIKLRGNS